jgi:hypothetical protein
VDTFAVTIPNSKVPLCSSLTGTVAVGAVCKINLINDKYLRCEVSGTRGTAPTSLGAIGTQVSETNGTVKWRVISAVPFAVVGDGTTVVTDGAAVSPKTLATYTAPGAYMDGAWIVNGTIKSASIDVATIKIADITGELTANRITAGSIATDTIIRSTSNYGDTTEPIWSINGNGEATFNNATIRGTIYATAGTLKGIQILDGNDNVILASGGSLQSQLFQNLLLQSEFTTTGTGVAVKGWEPGGIGTITFGVENARDPAGLWRPSNKNPLYLYQGARTGNEYGVGGDAYPTGGYRIPSAGIPVQGGKRYAFVCKAAAHRTNAQIGFDIFGHGNAFLVGAPSNQSSDSGGTNIANWGTCFAYIDVPAGAAYASLYIRKLDTNVDETNSFAWFFDLMFCEIPATQTTAPPYSPSKGLPYISSGNISTYIAGAAIGNAQIGNAEITTLKLANNSVSVSANNVGNTGSFSWEFVEYVITSYILVPPGMSINVNVKFFTEITFNARYRTWLLGQIKLYKQELGVEMTRFEVESHDVSMFRAQATLTSDSVYSSTVPLTHVRSYSYTNNTLNTISLHGGLSGMYLAGVSSSGATVAYSYGEISGTFR